MIIAAGPIDDLICILLNSICVEVAFRMVSEDESERTQRLKMGLLFIQCIVGVVVGIIFGLAGWLFKYIPHYTLRMYLKAIYVIVMCGMFTMAAKLSGFDNARFIGAFVFGLVLYRIWGEDGRPRHELHILYKFVEPFLFGCIGA